MRTGIYKITNNINGKFYIGKAYDIDWRFLQHSRGRKSSKYLQEDIKKYGLENFTFEVLELCDKDKLSERERFWILKLDAKNLGYNKSIGGEGGDTISNLSEERYEEYIKNISKPRREGFSQEQSERFSGEKNGMYGKHGSQKQKDALSKRVKGTRWINNGTKQTYVKVEVLDKWLNHGWTEGML